MAMLRMQEGEWEGWDRVGVEWCRMACAYSVAVSLA
jgi:hypothetical protein